MNTEYTKNGLLLECFNEFYQKIIYLKDKITTGNWLNCIGGTISNRQDLLKAAQGIKEELLALFDQQKALVYRTGGEYLSGNFEEVLYIMVALADEILLTLSWEGKSVWFAILLEAHLFKTRAAGDIFFAKLDQFLSNGDNSRKELAEIYLLAVSLGFEGRFRGNQDCGKSLEQYRNRLFFYLYTGNPNLTGKERRLAAQPYEYTITETPIKYLKYKSRALYFFLSGMALLLILSFVLWHFAVGDLFTAIETVKALI